MEFGFGEGGYQPSEYVKRYLPRSTFDLLIADEAHEYKTGGSAQGQAMGVIPSKIRKTVSLTGTLMGCYADDLFMRREVAWFIASPPRRQSALCSDLSSLSVPAWLVTTACAATETM